MADLTIHLINYQSLADDTTYEVSFGNLDEPVTTDDLVRLFAQFAMACGYSVNAMAASMIAYGFELYPKGDKEEEEKEEEVDECEEN